MAAKQYKSVEWAGVSLRQAALLSDLLKGANLGTTLKSLCYNAKTGDFELNASGDDLSSLDVAVTDLCVKASLPKPSTKVDSLPGLRLMAAEDIAAKVPAITDKSRETKTDINKGIVATTIDAVKNFFSDLFS